VRDQIEKWALEWSCPYCQAPAGEGCRTKSGRFSAYLHTGRQWVIQNAWADGYDEGNKDLATHLATMSIEELSNWQVRAKAGQRW
jgi:hypothetical protein